MPLLAQTFEPATPGWWVGLAFVAMFGACLGSFLNVVFYRLPRGENLAWPGSHCPRCQHAIRPWHNIPVLGWLLLAGRCYDCRQPISIKYPMIEALVALLAVLAAIASPWF